MFDTLKYQLFKFLLPTLFLILGLYLLGMVVNPTVVVLNNGVEKEIPQNMQFTIASLFFIAASIVWFLYLLGVINTMIGYIVMGAMVIVSVFVLYASYDNISSTVKFNTDFAQKEADIKVRLDDIKQAQLAYKEFYGEYCPTMDSLIYFVHNGKKMKIKKEGAVPDVKPSTDEIAYLYGDNRPSDFKMTEIEATALSKWPNNKRTELIGFIRDTSYVSVLEAVFMDPKRLKEREKMMSSLDFNADDLRYVPHTKNLVVMEVDSIEREGIQIQTLYIEMTHPMTKKGEDKILYSIGARSDNHLRESWN